MRTAPYRDGKFTSCGLGGSVEAQTQAGLSRSWVLWKSGRRRRGLVYRTPIGDGHVLLFHGGLVDRWAWSFTRAYVLVAGDEYESLAVWDQKLWCWRYHDELWLFGPRLLRKFSAGVQWWHFVLDSYGRCNGYGLKETGDI